MSPSSTASPGHLLDEQRRLSSGEARRWLEQHREGRLSYLSGRGPRSVVVSYAVVGDRILVRVLDYNVITHYAPGARVTLAVDGEIEATSASSPAIEGVNVTGSAAKAAEEDQPPVDLERFEESWPTGIKTSVFSLSLSDVHGARLRPTDEQT
jgi:hypothetical protein